MPEDVVNPSRYFIISGGYYYDSLACGSARHRRHSTRHELEASSLSGKTVRSLLLRLQRCHSALASPRNSLPVQTSFEPVYMAQSMHVYVDFQAVSAYVFFNNAHPLSLVSYRRQETGVIPCTKSRSKMKEMEVTSWTFKKGSGKFSGIMS